MLHDINRNKLITTFNALLSLLPTANVCENERGLVFLKDDDLEWDWYSLC